MGAKYPLMKRLFVILIALLSACAAFAQAEKSIIIDASKFRPVQTDALTGVNIDPIGLDYSKRPCARLKIKINRMTVEEINGIEVKVATNNAVMKCQTAQYDTGLIVEMTAKPDTRFYFHHNEFGDSNEVCLNLEPNKEYYLEAYLNQLYSIVVNSNVAEADVYIDNVFKGRTDNSNSLIIKDMLVGEHTLKVVYGGISNEQKIVVNSGSISFRQNVNTAASEPQFVVFTVEPHSAVVIIDNNHYTLTEGTMSVVLDNGNYNYTVTAAGYHSQSGTFAVTGDKVQKNIKLSADAATVTLTAPNQAEIWINNKKMGVGNWYGTLNSGTYIFEARKAGHTTTRVSKQITSAEAQQSYTLPAPTPIYGSLVVIGTPINADITLDGKVVGQTPLKLNNIIIGEHKLTVSKAGYNSYTQSVTVTKAIATTVNVTLTNQSAAPTSTTSAKGITSAPYKVGDYYNDGTKEGVVFEVTADGQHGKIVSMTQSTNELEWSSDGAEQKRKLGMSENDGKFNMSKVESISGWQDKYLPFKWCADLGEGWYLPSFEEAKRFTLVEPIHKVVNKTLVDRGATQLSGTYWTSSEGMFKTLSGCYYAINVSIGKAYRNSYHSQKFNDYYVRAVATFGEAPPITEKFYVVGDYYSVNGKEGVVFEASADGKSGKIVSVKGSKEELAWTTDKNEKYRPSGAISHTDGAYNMAVIRTIPDWQNKFPAFKWCSDLGDDWYLPSIDELSTIIKYKDIVNSKLHVSDWLNFWYFSSTEDKELRFDNGYAGQRVYGIFVSSGETKKFYKSSGGCYVRAVSTFGDLPSPKDIVIYNKKYNIGDYYNENGKEGVIFEVSEDGNHGKIVSMKQSAEKLMWVSDKKERKKLIGADSNTDGAYNMAKVKATSDWQNKYPAFKWCADLGEGWYLPAKYEMITIRRYSDKLNARLTDKFVDCWSSTETNEKAKTSNKDWNGYYYIGGGGCKNSSEYVRAVAKF